MISKVESVFNKLNIEYKETNGGRELQFRCICPEHNDRHASAFISSESGLWHCFSCGKSGNLNSFVNIATGGKSNAKEFITQGDGLKMRLESMYRASANKMLKYENDASFEESFNIEMNENFVKAERSDKAMEYLTKKRKLTIETIRRHNLMFAESGKYENRIIIPYYSNGIIIGMNSRYIGDCESGFRYRYMLNKERFSDYFYNWESLSDKKYCILVEGPFDLMYMTQCGYENTISTLNTSIREGHLKKLSKFKRIIFCFDTDIESLAGQNAVLKHASTILEKFPTIEILKATLPNGKDPNECSTDELRFVFGHLRKIRICNAI